MSKVVRGLSTRVKAEETNGFTVVETLIVLAVSSLLAVSALLLVSASQNKTQFRVAALDLKQQLEQTVNETRNGYYPNAGAFTCSTNPIGGPTVTAVAGPGTQGTHSDCIFLGKVLIFGVDGSGVNRSSFSVLPIVGNRLNGSLPVTSFTQSGSTPLASASAVNTIRNGLSFQRITYSPSIDGFSGSTEFGVLGLLDSLGQYAADTQDNVGSSVQTLNLYALRSMGNLSHANTGDIATAIKDTTVHGPNDATGVILNSVTMCFNSGGTGQSAVYTITGKGQLSVTLVINSTPCT